jgi:hypothetical protein
MHNKNGQFAPFGRYSAPAVGVTKRPVLAPSRPLLDVIDLTRVSTMLRTADKRVAVMCPWS